MLGEAVGRSLSAMAAGRDERPVVAEREAKSVGTEDTFPVDLTDPARLRMELDRLAASTAARLEHGGHSGRTVTVKVRLHDFSTLSRSRTLPAATDQLSVIRREARQLLDGVDVTGGVRLLGVSVSGISDTVQHELPLVDEEPTSADRIAARSSDVTGSGAAASLTAGPLVTEHATAASPSFAPGADVEHDDHGRGWVQGSGLGRVTVRFETFETGAGPVRTLAIDDPALRPVDPLPYPATAPDSLRPG